MIRRGYILAYYCAGIQINNAIFHSPLGVCVRTVLLLPVGCFISDIINKSGKLNVKQFYSPFPPHSTKNKTCNCTSYISIIKLYSYTFIEKIVVIQFASEWNRITPSGFMSSYDSVCNKFELFHLCFPN